MNGVGVVGVGGICISNSDRLIVFDGVGECEFNGGADDGDGGDDVVGGAIGFNREG